MYYSRVSDEQEAFEALDKLKDYIVESRSVLIAMKACFGSLKEEDLPELALTEWSNSQVSCPSYIKGILSADYTRYYRRVDHSWSGPDWHALQCYDLSTIPESLRELILDHLHVDLKTIMEDAIREGQGFIPKVVVEYTLIKGWWLSRVQGFERMNAQLSLYSWYSRHPEGIPAFKITLNALNARIMYTDLTAYMEHLDKALEELEDFEGTLKKARRKFMQLGCESWTFSDIRALVQETEQTQQGFEELLGLLNAIPEVHLDMPRIQGYVSSVLSRWKASVCRLKSNRFFYDIIEEPSWVNSLVLTWDMDSMWDLFDLQELEYPVEALRLETGRHTQKGAIDWAKFPHVRVLFLATNNSQVLKEMNLTDPNCNIEKIYISEPAALRLNHVYGDVDAFSERYQVKTYNRVHWPHVDLK